MDELTILLVEDEAIIALAESAAIESFGYKVIVAYTGESAVKTLSENPGITLILMDIDLGGGMDGTEAARRILSNRDMPIVFLTSHSERAMVEKVHGITRYGYVIKNSGDFVLKSSIEMAFELFASFKKIKEKEDELLREQYLLQALLEHIPDYVYFKDRESRFIRASYALARSFGLVDPTSLLGKTDFDFFTEEHARQAYEDEQAIVQTGRALRKDEKETRNGRPDAWVSTAKLPLRDKEGKIVGTFGVSRDITELKQAEKHLENETRLYATLSGINRTIVHVKEESELFDKVCSNVVAMGKFRTAWIGILDKASGKYIQVAQAVQGLNHFANRSNFINAIPLERSPIGAAIASGKVVLYEEPADGERTTSKDSYARSAAAIPFGASGRRIGTLNIYATEIGFFSQEERYLLEEIGLDMTFALENIELRKKNPS